MNGQCAVLHMFSVSSVRFTRGNANAPLMLAFWAFTRGHTDHFSNILADHDNGSAYPMGSAGCDPLFTVSTTSAFQPRRAIPAFTN